MAAILEMILERAILGEILLFMAPLWGAFLVGIFAGWAWKPKWADLVAVGAAGGGGETTASGEQKPSFGLGSLPSFGSIKTRYKSCVSWNSGEGSEERQLPAIGCSLPPMEQDQSVLNFSDFEHFRRLVEMTDRGPVWHQVIDRTTPTVSYKTWQRDQQTGPPQYRSRMVYEDVTPEFMRDFFWDDEFRAKWNDMIIHAATLEECRKTGTMIVLWIKKFPFFCSDREYIIGRRIWQSGGSYYCVTKGVPYPSLPRQKRPRRVDLYYSSWRIRAVESRRGDGQLTACEVLLFHYEDMGIPWEIAKLGVRQGMLGAIKNIEHGVHAYMNSRQAGEPLSHCAGMAHIYTEVDADNLRPTELMHPTEAEIKNSKKQFGPKIPGILIVGGVVALACTLDRGLLTKAMIFGVARWFGKIGRKP